MGNYLVHHGIKGQKWGVRRYQNDDGSLTEAGKKRYGTEYGDSEKRQKMTYDHGRKGLFGTNARAFRAHERAKKWESKADEARKDSKDPEWDEDFRTMAEAYSKKAERKAAKYHAREERIKKARANRVSYDKHTSTGRLRAQNILLGKAQADLYRDARANGFSRGKAIVSSMFGNPGMYR